MTPTAELADYVLPKTTLLEEEAVFVEGNSLAAMQAAVLPYGEVRTDFEIAMGLRDALRERDLVEFDVLPWKNRREFIDFQLKESEFTFDQVCEKGFIEIPNAYESYRATGFKTPSGKIEIASKTPIRPRRPNGARRSTRSPPPTVRRVRASCSTRCSRTRAAAG